MFTSGSTGKPKGVRISFANLNAFIRDFMAYPGYAFTPADRFLQIYDLSFDASVHCYAVPLTLGASVFTVPPDGIKYLEAYRLMRDFDLTFAKMPPSTLQYLKSYFDQIRLPLLRYCLLGGEAFPAALVEEWEKCIPNALIQNVYGPTEACINCTIYDWNAPGGSKKEHLGTGSIGKAFGSNRTLVVDTEGREATAGKEGELLVAGDQVSPGYWQRPDLDRKAFLELGPDGARYYRTGDLVVRDEEGDLLYLGRNDEQVQVRGYRVELGEIEMIAADFLKDSAVVAFGRQGEAGDMEILLAVESAQGKDLEDSLKKHLSGHLPPYMLPASILVLPEFPRLVSGKTDRRALLGRFDP
jgi:non-ribosomal peptide synthetase component F